MRRNLINAVLAVILVPSTIVLVLRLMPNPPLSEVGFTDHSHRVAVALDEVMQAEFTAVKHGPINFSQGIWPATQIGVSPVMSQYQIPKELPVLWLTMGNAKTPSIWSLDTFSITGTARDGRTISASIVDAPLGEGCVVDFHGDAEAARTLSGKIADRLAHPKHKHESPEDRAALMAFFQPKSVTFTSFTNIVDTSVIPASIPPALEPAGLDPKDAIR